MHLSVDAKDDMDELFTKIRDMDTNLLKNFIIEKNFTYNIIEKLCDGVLLRSLFYRTSIHNIASGCGSVFSSLSIEH